METTEVTARARAYRERIHATETEVDAKAIAAEFHAFYNALTTGEREEADRFLEQVVEEHREEMADIERMLETLELKRKGAVVYEGREYLLGEWLTIADYCRMYNQKPNTVMNWIAREVVPKTNVVTIPELNNLKLLKNELYRAA